MAFKHIMVDLETMDNKPTAAITAIGAVAFDLADGKLNTS
jgi:exodeoxyribonuclease VIII